MSDVMLSGNDGGGGSHVYPSQQSGGGGSGESEHPLQQLRFDVLDANSQGIYLTQCQNYDEAERVLVEIYNAISEAEKDVRRVAAVAAEGTEHDSADDDVAQQLIDQLKATTLNNISFVVYHKGLFRQAIAHLEAAQELERKWGIQSGVSAVNACVLYNAVGQYAVASQYALQGIDILRRDAVAAASTGQTSDERSKLWGAAWHNLAVAQLQLADPTSALENSNVLYMFENSMGACQELLGKSHPMTKAVTETYRIMRKELLARGAYKPHIHNKTATANDTPRMHTYYGETQSGSRKSPYTGKRMGPSTLRGNERKENKQLSVVLLSQDRTRYVEKVEAEPFHKPSSSNSARRPPTGGSMSSANGRMVVHSGGGTEGGGGVVVDPSEAVLNSKIICRRLMQGLPSGPEVGANKYTPSSSSGRASHSMQQFRRQSLANASASSPDGNKAYLQKQGLQGVSLRGNLALAGSLYANPHPLTGGTSPRGGGKMRSHNSNGGYIPLPPPSAGNNGSLMMGTSPRRSVLPPPPTGGGHRPFPPSTGKSSVRLPHLTPGSINNVHQQTSSSRTFGTPPTTANNNAYTNNSNSTPMSGTITHVSEGGSMMVPRPPASPPQHSSRHELLMGDMWVEAPVHAPSPQGSSYSSPDVRASGGGGVGGSGGAAAAYHQQLYSIDDDDRVVDPSRFAHPV